MHRVVRGIRVAVMVFLSAMTIAFSVGCGKTPSTGLVAGNGISDPKDVQFVISQSSTWTTPQPQLFPLQRPHRITDGAAIKAFYDALNHPKGTLMPKTASNSRLAFVAKNGRVAMFAVGGGEDCESCRADLSAAFRLALSSPEDRKFDETTVPPARLSRLEYHSGGSVITLARAVQLTKVEKPWTQLLGTFNPLSLRGNVLCNSPELKRFLAWATEYLEAELKKPVTFEAIVVPPDLDPNWPPKKGDSRASLRELECSKIYVARLPQTRSKFVRFFFVLKTGDCLATDAVDPRAILNYSGKFGQPVYGPDLFEEVVSEIKKP